MQKYSSYILSLLIVVLAVILYANSFGPLASLQKSIDRMLVEWTSDEGEPKHIVIVAVDEYAQDMFGAWPWDRDRIADLLAATAAGEPKVLVANFELTDDADQDSAGHTKVLADQLSWMTNVVLPYDIAVAQFRSGKTSNPDFLFERSVTVANQLGLLDEDKTPIVRKIFLPSERLLQWKPHLGFEYTMPDDDRVLRHEPLLMHYEGYYYPSLTLAAATAFLEVPLEEVTIHESGLIELGDEQEIHSYRTTEMMINFATAQEFRRFSAAEVLEPEFDRSVFKDKLILVGVTDPAHEDMWLTAHGERLPRLLVRAAAIENIINDNLLKVRRDHAGVDMLILFLVGGLFAYILPMIRLRKRILFLGAALVLAAAGNYALVAYANTLALSVYLLLELTLLLIVAAPLIDSDLLKGEQATKSGKKRAAPKVEIKKDAKQKPSTQEIAAAPVSVVKDKPNDSVNVPTAAMPDARDDSPIDYQALDLDGVTLGGDPAGQDPNQPTEHAPVAADNGPISTEEPVIVGASDSSGDIFDGPPDFNESGGLNETPTDLRSLGRYQILGTLGKGAMGHVYKGIDPAINRPVALKTIRLDFVNDPQEMEELKERLHREAQAAGKLSHPNIVTIYDVGSDGTLQYIAMEYLEGQTLEQMIKRKTKFNFKIIAQVIIQICGALDYAHSHGIVHRDIKPANVMVMKDYRVKVMDYGIARVDSSSMTKTGIAMGTPNYISPEQLQGLEVDHRADLFSLGVVMYELLLGRRPFKGENITSLIYSILNHHPEKPSNVDPDIPLLFDNIISKALQKQPRERYQRAGEIMRDLSDFVESFNVTR